MLKKYKLPFLGFMIMLTFAFSSTISAQYFPSAQNWLHKDPKEVGLNQAAIDSLVRIASTTENKVERDLRLANIKAYSREPNYQILGPMKQRGGPAGVVIKDGYIVAEWGDIERVDMTFSVTKSFLSTMCGLAVDQGLIANVNDRVSKTIWDGTFDGNHNGAITWKHLLQQSSDWYGCQFGLCDWADRPPREGGIDEWRSRPLLTPGTNFEYNDVRVNLLAYALTQVHRKPLAALLKSEIMDHIGASTTWRWHGYESSYIDLDGSKMQVASGGGHFGGGLFINTLDMARFGYLMLKDGMWDNKRIISSQWIKEARESSTPNKDYGYMWWLNQSGGMKEVGKDVFTANGFGGNYIAVDPTHNMVIVTRWLDNDYLDDILRWAAKASTK